MVMIAAGEEQLFSASERDCYLFFIKQIKQIKSIKNMGKRKNSGQRSEV
jgi:hypothetical protein